MFIQHEHVQQRHLLNKLLKLGVHLLIDDFVTGYSSLSYLHDLPVQQVKIDRIFLARAANNDQRPQLFAGIASLAQNLGLQVVAEGVETRAELALAQPHGCDLVQGLLLGGPMSAEAVCACFGAANVNWFAPALQRV